MLKQTFNLVIDKRYFFSFHTDLEALNGVYSVSSIMNYEDVEAILSNPVQDIYVAVNKLDIYISQKIAQKYRDEVYYKLQSMTNPELVFFFPDSLIIEYPLEDFKEINKYMFLCEIGVINDPSELEAAVPIINQTIWQTLGIDPITMISTFETTYLSQKVIDDHTAARYKNKQTESVFTKLATLQEELRVLKERCAKYETIIIDLYENKGTPIPEKTLQPVISQFGYSQDAFGLRSTIWDTPMVHTTSHWQISKTTDFVLPIVDEVSTTQLLTASFNKTPMADGKYYAKVRYGGVVVGSTELVYSDWSPMVSMDLIN